MKLTSTALTMTFLFSHLALAADESAQLQNELNIQGVHLVGLMNTTQNELIQKIELVGGAQVLDETPASSKMQYRARLVITNSSTPIVKIEFKKGETELSQDAANEVFDAAFSYFAQHPNPELQGKVSNAKFDAAIKCLVSGQGQEQIIWCGFFEGAL